MFPEILFQFGLLGIVLGGIGFGIYKGALWISPRIEALVKSHIEFVDKASNSIQRIEANQEKMATILNNLCEQSNGKVSPTLVVVKESKAALPDDHNL